MLAKRFEEQVRQHPKAVAVQVGNVRWSYAELNSFANQIAHQMMTVWPMRNAEARDGDAGAVGLLFEHGMEMIAGTLAAVKAGKVYVPLDPGYPKERLAYILADAQVSLLVTNARNRELAEELAAAPACGVPVNDSGADAEVTLATGAAGSVTGAEALSTEQPPYSIPIMNISALDPGTPAENPDLPIGADQMAYILYTSGSTGRPKGVMQTHGNVCYFVSHYAQSFGIGCGDRMTLFSAFSHDAAVMDIYAGLLHGAALYPMSIKTQIAMEEMAPWLIREQITVYHSVPTVYRYFAQTLRGGERFPHLRMIILGGEKVMEHDVAFFQSHFGPETRLVNLYGQSESSFNSAQFFTAEGGVEKITLGKPVPGTEFLVINEEGEEAVPFEVGEILVQNGHLAPGYWRDEEKTRKAFVRDPEMGRLYRTGDLGRVLLDGSIEFVGRKDFQVKIRGFRVELGEIESAVLRVEGVRDAVVIAREDRHGETLLCAYITASDDLPETLVRRRLAEMLPDYMVPASVVRLERMPLTPNNKTDRKALQEMEHTIRSGEYTPPATATEERLAALTAEIVRADRIGVGDNLFEMGLHSLRAVTWIARVYKEFQVKPSLKQLFGMPTVREMAAWIDGAEREGFSPVVRIPEREYYPVSSAQKRLLLLHQLDRENLSYNMPKVLRVTGDVCPERIEAALRKVTARHESLRTAFFFVDGEPVQKVFAEEETAFRLERRQAAEGSIKEAVREFIRPFDLAKAPLLRAELLESGGQTWLLLDLHHIIADGTSTGIFLGDFLRAYEGEELPPLELQYKDFTAWQRDFFESEAFARQEAYWLEIFAGDIPVLTLPTDRPRPPVMDFAGDSVRFGIDPEQTERLRQVARQHGATLYMVLLAAYNLLLSRYSGQEDIVVGAPVAGRNHADLGQMMGMFVNTLAMRNQPSGRFTFAEFLGKVREHALRAFECQDYPFETLVEKLEVRRDLSRNPLFDVSFILQNMETAEAGEAEIRFRFEEFVNPAVKFDLALTGIETPDGLRCKLEYRTGLFHRAAAERMAGHFVNILCDVAADPDRLLSAVQMLSAEEREVLVRRWNETAQPVEERTVPELFHRQAVETPEAAALILGAETLTYGELNRRAEKVAMALRERGLRSGEVVGLMAGRSFAMPVGLLGIWKAGGVYLPLDPAYPAGRLEYMLHDGGAVMVVAEDRNIWGDASALADRQPVLYLDQAAERGETDSYADEPLSPRQLAYIIYTSGSTGRPKGVMIEHGSISNTLQWRKREYALTGKEKMLQTFSGAFDGFLTSCLTPLTAGAAVVLPDAEQANNPFAMRRMIAAERVTHCIAVPSLYASWLSDAETEDLASLRIVTLAGEAVSPELVQRSRNLLPGVELVNEYGPTENSVVSTWRRALGADSEVTIGGPIANTQVYLLDAYMNLVPVGVVGEICLAGKGLARGYVNLPEVTAERFVSHPFRAGERLYRTGDLARWLADGRLEYIGRMDEQVKLRGYRIEPGEIENALRALPGMGEAAVVQRTGTDGAPYLAAYYTVRPESGLTPAECMAGLRQRLPEYMIPARFIPMDRLPLTSNGKLDRKALPAPEDTGGLRQYVPPTDEVETELAAIWAELFGVAEVGIEDHFFEMGGHSLKAAALTARVSQRFHVELPLREVFRTPTVKGQAAWIRQAERQSYYAIEKAPEQAVYPLSSAQKRMYALHQLMGGTTYNIPGAFHIEGNLNPARLEAALLEMIRRHESLRTSFILTDGEPVQRIEKQVRFTLRQPDLRTEEEEAGDRPSGDAGYRGMVAAFIQPFDLSRAPLLRVQLVRRKEGYILMYDMHHIISDGLSMEIFINEWFGLYAGRTLPELRIQYRDFAVWQKEFLRSEALRREEAYWREVFAGEIPVLNLPTDFPRPAVMGTAGGRMGWVLDESIAAGLYRLTAERHATLFMVLLAAYNLFLAKYTGQDDFVVGTPVAGRPHADLENMIGIFVNTLAMRNSVSMQTTFLQLLEQVRENALAAFENQNYQFEMLVEALQPERDLSRSPLFDTMFALQSRRSASNRDDGPDGLRLRPFAFENNTAKFDLSLNVLEGAQGIYCSFEFSTDLFRPATVERMARHLNQVLYAVTADPSVTLADVGILTEEERRRQLMKWNATAADYDRERTVLDQLDTQTAEAPDAVALISAGQTMTYGELNRRAAVLAARLRREGVRTGDVVALLTERSFAMIVGILGILRAGGCYLPMDVKYPATRIEYMLADSGAGVLLAQPHLTGGLRWPGTVIDPDAEESSPDPFRREAAATAEAQAAVKVRPDDPAYIIYTSGSTGNPKGVMVEHRNMCAYLNAFLREMQLTCDDTAIQQASYAFDASVEEIFAILSVGGRLVLPAEEDLLDLDRLTQVIGQYRVTVMSCPPLILNEWNQRPPLPSVRIFINSGDVLKAEYITHLVTYARVYNVYGPTETTIAATFYRCPAEEIPAFPPIGKPIANYRAYIIDREGHLLPQGVPGEICIAGEGVARGYWKRDELTAAKFIAEPFAAGGRMYRTGDLGRWLSDGNIEFLGRMDHQVKIRGFRIELGEIEAQLMRLEEIHEVFVTDRADTAGSKYLCAYFTAARPMEQSELRDRLAALLPQYMIPAFWIQLAAMPVTANGKVDRRALPVPDIGTRPVDDYVQPSTDTESGLARIWADVLRAERVGIRDNFFALGGDSIKAIQILARANQQGIYLTVKDIFKYGTIESILQNADFRQKKLHISQAEVEGEMPLTPIQMWFFEQRFQHPQYYTQSNLFTLRDDADEELLERALQKLITHHDALRMTYRPSGEDGRRDESGEPGMGEIPCVQYNRKTAELSFALRRVTLAAVPDPLRRERLKEYCIGMRNGLDLSEGVLMQAAVFDLGADGKRLFITIHHLVVDGVSWRILLEDLQTLYNSELTQPLPPKTSSYQDWAVRLADYVRTRTVDTEYWDKIEAEKLPSLAEGNTTACASHFGGYRSLLITLSAAETEALLTRANWAYHTGINDLLLAALALALDEALAVPSVFLTLEGHGREEIIGDVDISRTVGWFTSAYPVYFEAKETIEKTVKHVKESLRRIPEKGIPFGLKRYLGGDPHLRQLNPEMTFNYLGQFDNIMTAGPRAQLLDGAPESAGPSVHPENTNSSLLDFTGAVAGGKLQMTLSYHAGCLDEAKMRGLQMAYQQKLSDVIAHCCGQDEQSHTASDFGLEDEFASEEDFELLAGLYDMDDDGEGE